MMQTRLLRRIDHEDAAAGIAASGSECVSEESRPGTSRSDASLSRLKRAELTSGVGALLLGLGLGVMLARYLEPYGFALLVLGLLMHVWGMLSKHRLESSFEAASAWWSEALYWLCWAALVSLAGYMGVRMVWG